MMQNIAQQNLMAIHRGCLASCFSSSDSIAMMGNLAINSAVPNHQATWLTRQEMWGRVTGRGESWREKQAKSRETAGVSPRFTSFRTWQSNKCGTSDCIPHAVRSTVVLPHLTRSVRSTMVSLTFSRPHAVPEVAGGGQHHDRQCAGGYKPESRHQLETDHGGQANQDKTSEEQPLVRCLEGRSLAQSGDPGGSETNNLKKNKYPEGGRGLNCSHEVLRQGCGKGWDGGTIWESCPANGVPSERNPRPRL